jgi:hypothetical protein
MKREDWPSNFWDRSGGSYPRRRSRLHCVRFYRAITGEKRSPWLIVLRAVTLAVLLFMFLRPVLNISTVLPQDSYLAVVIDNSESMTIKDDGKRPPDPSNCKKQLTETKPDQTAVGKVQGPIYRFDKEAERIESLEETELQR